LLNIYSERGRNPSEKAERLKMDDMMLRKILPEFKTNIGI
jgi:hypothetical protein